MEFKSVLEETKSKKKPAKKISKDTRKVKIEKLVDKVLEKEVREITSLDDKKELQKSVSILNRYYFLQGVDTPETEKRKKLVLTSPEKIKIRLKKIGDSQFFVNCIILADKKKDFVKCDWLHVDSIVKERKIMAEKGSLNHPVFKIVCLSDLWDRAKIVKVKKEKAKK